MPVPDVTIEILKGDPFGTGKYWLQLHLKHFTDLCEINIQNSVYNYMNGIQIYCNI